MEGHGPRPRILIVDDDAENRRMLPTVLEGEGLFVVGEASDGREAVDLVGRASPDIVPMDLRMPVMGGIEATRLIKESRPTTQVLILTTYEGPFPTRSAEEVGAHAYLLKGCSVELILQVISQAWNHGAGLGLDGRRDPGSAGSISPA